jgi:MFS family permease
VRRPSLFKFSGYRRLNWYYGWNVIGITLLFQSLCIGMHYYCFTLWVVPWSQEFGAVRSHIMMAIVASQVISGLLSPFAGRALDRLPSHWLICGGALTFSLGLVLIAFAQAVWQIIAVYLLVLPLGLVLTGAMAAQTLATRWFTKDRGLAIACATLGTSLGGFLLPPLAALLMNHFGWRVTFFVFAAICSIVVTPVAWRILQRRPPHEEAAMLEYSLNQSTEKPAALSTAEILRSPDFRIIVLSFMPLLLTFNAIQMNLGAYAQDIGVTQQQTAFLVAQLSVLMLIGKILFGKLSDRFDQRALLWCVVAGMIVSILCISAASSYALLSIGTAILGFVYAGYLPLLGATIATRFDTRAFGQVMGLSGTFLAIGAAGSVIAASLRDIGGSYSIAFLLFLFVLIPAAIQMRQLR